MLKKIRNAIKNKKIEIALDYLKEFENNNSSQREVKSFKIWLVAKKLRKK